MILQQTEQKSLESDLAMRPHMDVKEKALTGRLLETIKNTLKQKDLINAQQTETFGHGCKILELTKDDEITHKWRYKSVSFRDQGRN